MKDPAFLFYYQDYMFGTYFLNRREKGAYMDLLCYQADKGSLTLQEIKDLLNGDFECWEKLKDKFIEEEGKFYNKRLKAEKEKREKYSNSRRDNRKNICSSYVEHMENENINENRIRIKKEEFRNSVFAFSENYSKEMLEKFFSYWSELNKSKTKMRWELQETFEIARRLVTWASRDKDIIPASADPKTYNDMLQLAEKYGAGVWQKYESIKKPGAMIAMWHLKQ